MQTTSESTPDIIVITGDLIDMNHTNIDTALDFAKNAVQIAPIYYVNGNHEAGLSQYDELKEGLKSVGVIVLEDEAIQLEHNGSTVTLIDLSDPNFAIRNDVTFFILLVIVQLIVFLSWITWSSSGNNPLRCFLLHHPQWYRPVPVPAS